jgi:hypothetical protein
MSKLNFAVLRYPVGHPLFSAVPLYKDGKPVYSTFGEIHDGNGTCLHHTLERADTLIPEGTYDYCFYNSPDNGWVVLLKNVPHRSLIEHHGVNWVVNNNVYQLLGCTGHGLAIDVHTPMLVSSQAALKPWFASVVKASGKILVGGTGTIIDGDFGHIEYKTFGK